MFGGKDRDVFSLRSNNAQLICEANYAEQIFILRILTISVTSTESVKMSGGKDSHLRRENPPDLQSGAIDYSATSG